MEEKCISFYILGVISVSDQIFSTIAYVASLHRQKIEGEKYGRNNITQRFILGIPWTPVPLHFGWTRDTR